MKTKNRKRVTTILFIIIVAATIILSVNFSLTASAYTEYGYMETPQITVLTHGLGGTAAHWSNNGVDDIFTEDTDSLLYKLSIKAGGATIYRANTTNGESNSVYTLYKNYDSTLVTSIENTSKHIIIVFNSQNPGDKNETVYNEFKTMLNDIVAQVRNHNNGKRPIVNLIGHSRGGLTNLQYALDYPKNVNSLISIGTPYFGSQAAKSFGELILGSVEGLKDINDETIYNEYYERWSKDYEKKYKDINSIAIGGATTVSYLREILSKSSAQYANELSTLLACYENALIQGVTFPFLRDSYPNLVKQYPALATFGEEKFKELVTLINNEVHYDTWYSDVLVPVDSQQGVSGQNNYLFTKYVREFNEDNAPENPKLTMVEQLPVIHNIETYDATIHDYILKNIIMKSGDIIDNEISNVNKIEYSNNSMNNLTWQIKIRNTHKETYTYVYNLKMCFLNDAKNWSGLNDLEAFRLEPGETKIVNIDSNGTATSIAISYMKNNIRKILYADNLWYQSDYRFEDNIYKMTVYNNSLPYYTYSQNDMEVGIACKKGDTWTIELKNNTDDDQNFEFNAKMCFNGDAKNWTGINHVNKVFITKGEVELIKIQEYLLANSIAISYNIGIDRYIFYAYNLATPAGTMTSYPSKTPTHYTQYGIDIAIVSKQDSTWKIQLTNNTGSGRTFEFNARMCFEGDAQNWTGLNHVQNLYLAAGQTTQEPIEITEYGTATSITISYMDGIYRKIFYAKDLNATTRTMTAMSNIKDTTQKQECIAKGTLVTLADGRQVPVETLTGDEMLLVWNMKTGSFDYAPMIFIDSDPIGHYEVIRLTFSDGTKVNVISEHGFWDVDLNRYVYLDKNAAQYIGHSFIQQDGNGMKEVILTGVEINVEVTTPYSPVTYSHFCYFVNGMLSMPGGISGFINIFEVDAETMTYNAEAMAADIEEYGLFTYEEFSELFDISEEVFEAFSGQYLKVAIGKGMITYEHIGELIESYAEFL